MADKTNPDPTDPTIVTFMSIGERKKFAAYCEEMGDWMERLADVRIEYGAVDRSTYYKIRMSAYRIVAEELKKLWGDEERVGWKKV